MTAQGPLGAEGRISPADSATQASLCSGSGSWPSSATTGSCTARESPSSLTQHPHLCSGSAPAPLGRSGRPPQEPPQETSQGEAMPWCFLPLCKLSEAQTEQRAQPFWDFLEQQSCTHLYHLSVRQGEVERPAATLRRAPGLLHGSVETPA